MSSLFFWKDWHKEYRLIWYLILSVFAFSLIYLWITYLQGDSNVISWMHLQEQKEIETTVHSFQLGPFNLEVKGDAYTIHEYLHGSPVTPNTLASYLFIGILGFAALVLLSVITTTERFWFYAGMTLFIVFTIYLRFETIGLFGFFNQIPTLVILALFVSAAFYFNKIRPTTPFAYRLITFFIIGILISVCIALFAQVNFPFYQLAITAFVPALILSIFFIMMIGHEIIRSFLYVASQGRTKNLNHLLIISTVYLVNIVITCLHEIGFLDWNFIYVNIFLLLSISSIVGIWGFRHREELYNTVLPLSPIACFLYLALATICFITTAQLLGNANDPGVKILRDMIIFSHVGFGIVFLMYLFSNFSPMLARNIPVYPVLYRPTRMPYFTFRFAGLIIMLAFVFNSDINDYVYKAFSTYYTSGADLNIIENNQEKAIAFYERARAQAFGFHRANYSLATLRTSEMEYAVAHEDYHDSNVRNPNVYSYTNNANLFAWQRHFNEAIEEYKLGMRHVSDDGPLASNLALSYVQMHKVDSAVKYIELARKTSSTRDAAETNFFALLAQEKIPVNIDSIASAFNSTSRGLIANALALSTITGKPYTPPTNPLENKRLDLYSATTLNNYILKNAKSVDTTFIEQAYRLVSDSLNQPFSEAIKASLAIAYYHQGNVARALEVLAEQVYLSQSYQGKFNYTMGLWALEQKNPSLAAAYFSYADEYEFTDAPFYLAIALTEAGHSELALSAWDSVAAKGNPEQKLITRAVRRILTMPLAEVTTLDDVERYQFCRYRIGVKDSIVFNRVVNDFNHADYKAQALLDYSAKCLQADRLSSAIHYYNRIAGLQLSDERLYDDVRHFELLLLSTRQETRLLAQQINKGIEFGSSRRLEKMYYTALIAESSGDTTTAKKMYSVLGKYNPFFVDGIISAADFYKRTNPGGFEAYTILAESIHVNKNSLRLWKAYYSEALRKGFDDYAASAAQTIQDLERISH